MGKRSGAATDRQRLARIFGFEAVKPWGALGGGVLLAIIPQTWIAGGALMLGLAAMVVDENRKIADGLAEVKAWGFPVDGYKAWLLAYSPTFDVELRRDVTIELIKSSLLAVDASIVVESRSERVVRVIMRRIEMEGGEGQPSVLVGDRKRLFEVHDRVLAPLHTDVGVVALRMGDRDSLTALVATPQSATADAAFREQALVAPPDLQSLAHAGTSRLRPPQEANALKLRTDRLLYATGQVPTTAGVMTLALFGATIIGGIIGAVWGLGGALGIVLGSGVGSLGAWGMRRNDVRRLESSLETSRQYSFPVEGYDNWLLSGRPQLDIEFSRPVPEAELAELLAPTHQKVVVTWLSDVVVRLEHDPVIHMAAQGIKSFWGGDPFQFAVLAEHVFEPLATRYGIVAVRMGGYLDRRA